jgi:hypothetical protein
MPRAALLLTFLMAQVICLYAWGVAASALGHGVGRCHSHGRAISRQHIPAALPNASMSHWNTS